MNESESFTIKEILVNSMEEMRGSVTELHKKIDSVQETASQGLSQATKTNGRVNGLEAALTDISQIIKKHDELLLTADTTSKITEKRDKTYWDVVKFSFPFLVALLGWLGHLYIEDTKKKTAVEVVQLLEDKYNIELINGTK